MHTRHPAETIIQLACASLALLLGGCASIFNGGNRTLTIDSDPPGAKATVSRIEGETIVIKTTPCTVSLDPRRGYFKGQGYILSLELPGYRTAEVQLVPTISGWYFGNILLGGLLGMVVVDPLTGSMWNIEPSKIQARLSPVQTSMIEGHTGFVVVLAGGLTAAERASMTRIR